MGDNLIFNSGKIKIMHIIRPADGGMKEHLYSLIKYLQEYNFEIVVACPPNSSVAKRLCQLKVKIVFIDIVDNLNPKKDFSAIRQLIMHFKEEKPKIIHTHGAKAGYLGRIAGVIAGVPKIVTTIHGFTLENDMSSFKKSLFKIVERFLAKYTDNIITVSGALKHNLINSCKIDEGKIVTIYNGVNCEDFFSNRNSIEIAKELSIVNAKKISIVGVVARLAAQKGIRYFIEAAKIVIEKFPETRFIVVGDGPEKSYLKKLSAELNLDGKLFFLGERNDVYQLLKDFDIFVLPSVSEGLSITALEAMAANCPIVATNTGGIPEIVRDRYNGMIVEPRNPLQLAEGICHLIENKSFAKKLAANGNFLVKNKYSVLQMVNSTKGLYYHLLDIN